MNIKACPRCGAPGKLGFDIEKGKYFVCCSKHIWARTGYAESKEEAIEKWNKGQID